METIVAGVAVFDYDNDGLLDVYFVNGARLPGSHRSDAIGIVFTATTGMERSPMSPKRRACGMGVAAGDYDK